MGCDIHMYAEYRAKEKRRDYDATWKSFGGRLNPGRNYDVFAVLAGVRSCEDDPAPVAKPRGFPEDAGWAAKDDNRVFVSETPAEDYVTRARAEEWVKSGSSKWVGEHWVSHPDHHSHSWLTADEYEAALKSLKDDPFHQAGVEYWALLAALRCLEEKRQETRIVFWFDN